MKLSVLFLSFISVKAVLFCLVLSQRFVYTFRLENFASCLKHILSLIWKRNDNNVKRNTLNKINNELFIKLLIFIDRIHLYLSIRLGKYSIIVVLSILVVSERKYNSWQHLKFNICRYKSSCIVNYKTNNYIAWFKYICKIIEFNTIWNKLFIC